MDSFSVLTEEGVITRGAIDDITVFFAADHDEYLWGRKAQIWSTDSPEYVKVRFYDLEVHVAGGLGYFFMPLEWFRPRTA